MVFSSIIFIFAFLPTVLLTVWGGVAAGNALHVGKEKVCFLRNTILTLASFAFYAWGEPAFVFLLFGVAWLNYWLGKKIQSSMSVHRRKLFFSFGLLINLGLLFVYKYGSWCLTGFYELCATLSLITVVPEIPALPLPLGISFFSFQALSYLVDVYRGDVVAANTYIAFSCYLTMFSQLVAGPIVRYADIKSEIDNLHISLDDVYTGMHRFILGFGKKVLIANQMGIVADSVFAFSAAQLTSEVAWWGIIAYSMQIYYDFSAYSDMAIGIGKMLGFAFMENFLHPYGALSMQDFWHKWHISLSTWFRDYLYIPLGGNRKGVLRLYSNQIIVFIFCGLWHGANLTFLCWGIWHGLFLVLERLLQHKIKFEVPAVLRLIYVWLVFLCGWVFFRAESIHQAIVYLQVLFDVQASTVIRAEIISDKMIFAILLAIVGSTGWLGAFWRKIQVGALRQFDFLVEGARGLVDGCLLILSTCFLLGGSYNPFIYFRF